jgi:hypothetical protein
LIAVNVINIIFPYKREGVWVFDDERVGLDKEPLVAGVRSQFTSQLRISPDVLLDRATAEIPNAVNGFRLTFSQHEFPEYDECIRWLREESGGNVYWSDKFEMEGWLCPALLRYFEKPPTNIYLKAEAK